MHSSKANMFTIDLRTSFSREIPPCVLSHVLNPQSQFQFSSPEDNEMGGGLLLCVCINSDSLLYTHLSYN